MMAKLAQTVSIYVLSIIVPVLVISVTRNEHPLTLLHEIYTYVKKTSVNSWRLAMRVVQKAPLPPYLNTLLTRLGLPPQPPPHNHTTNEPVVAVTEELADASISIRDEYADLLTCTIGLLRQGEDLSLAYRELTYIPTFFASTPEGTLSTSFLHITPHIYLVLTEPFFSSLIIDSHPLT